MLVSCVLRVHFLIASKEKVCNECVARGEEEDCTNTKKTTEFAEYDDISNVVCILL